MLLHTVLAGIRPLYGTIHPSLFYRAPFDGSYLAVANSGGEVVLYRHHNKSVGLVSVSHQDGICLSLDWSSQQW